MRNDDSSGDFGLFILAWPAAVAILIFLMYLVILVAQHYNPAS